MRLSSPCSISTALATKRRWIVHALLTCLLPASPHNTPQDCRLSGGRYHSVSFTTLSPVPSTGPAIGQALGKCLWEEGGRQGTRPWCPLRGQPSGGSLREGSPGHLTFLSRAPAALGQSQAPAFPLKHLWASFASFPSLCGSRRLTFTSTHCGLSSPCWPH